MAPTCSDENCSARCHQPCNRLSISQTRHARDSGRSITWKCPQHGTGIAKILLCHLLQFMTFKSNPSCDNVCHLAAMFSGFVNPRGTSRARALSTRVWHCHLLSSPSVTSHPPLSPDNSPPCPTPPSLKSLLNQGLSLAEAKSSKEKCAKCSAALRSNTVLFQGIPSKM